jgi:hypothetical protein
MTSADLHATIAHMGAAARAASTRMMAAPTAAKNAALRALARRLREGGPALQAANAHDLARADTAGLAAPLVDRLKLTPRIIETAAAGCDEIAAMPDPIGEITELRQRPSGISVGRMRVPLGVFGMIYESRPNVTIEAASLGDQERQRLHPARRLGGDRFERRAVEAGAGRAAGSRPAARRGAAGRDDRPSGGRSPDHRRRKRSTSSFRAAARA